MQSSPPSNSFLGQKSKQKRIWLESPKWYENGSLLSLDHGYGLQVTVSGILTFELIVELTLGYL